LYYLTKYGDGLELHGEVGKYNNNTIDNSFKRSQSSIHSNISSNLDNLLHSPNSLTTKSRSSTTIENYSVTIKNDDIKELHLTMLKAIVTSGIHFSILDNDYFKEYQMKIFRFLRINNYPLPNYYNLVEKLLPELYAALIVQESNILSKCSGVTLTIDGVTDKSGKNLYGMMIMKIGQQPILVDFLNFDSDSNSIIKKKRMTGETLHQATVDLIKARGIKPSQIAACVTDNPSVMIKYRRLMSFSYKHMIPIYCSLHVFNKLIEWFLSHPQYRVHIKNILALVNAFRAPVFLKKLLIHGE
jgi:hypothetical protein